MWRAFLIATMLMPAAPALAQASDNEAVIAAARAFDRAQQQADRATLERMIAPDFLLVNGSARVGDRRDFIAGFTDPANRIEPIEIVDPLFLRPAPDVAIVGGEARVRGSEGGKPFARHYRYADTFVRRGDQWIVAYIQMTPLPD